MASQADMDTDVLRARERERGGGKRNTMGFFFLSLLPGPCVCLSGWGNPSRDR